jgi:hypothetical protein
MRGFEKSFFLLLPRTAIECAKAVCFNVRHCLI